MATKYILDPSGNIIKVDNGVVETNNDGTVVKNKPEDTEYLSEVNIGQNVIVDEFSGAINQEGLDFVSTDTLQDNEELYIIGKNNNDSSFGFINNGDNSQKSYKPFNSFIKNQDNLNHPKAFADEFEILTGMRLRDDEVRNDTLEVTGLLFTYLAESIVRALVLEGIVLANRAITSGNGNQSRVAERYKLRLGKYDFTEFDVFTKYVFNVLNYPHESSNAEERISAYFLGFSSWLAPDMAIDLENIIKENSNSLNSIDGAVKVLPDGFLSLPTSGLITSTAVATAEVFAAAATNTTVVNRAKLLLRKFYQERYWDSTQLYRAKNKNDFLDFFTDLNYYYFKFYIERVQIGLKLLNKYLYDDSYLKTRTIRSPLNRVSAARFIQTIDTRIVNPGTKDKTGNYNWSYKNSGEKHSQTTRVRGLPQGLNLNYNFYRSLALNGKETLDIGQDLMQNFYKSEERKLPSDLVREIENHLESEYMPFYFHDLRTNEIISFHAFIESISDSFSPEYSSASGFGRIDDVKSYVKTTRNINITFIVAATSESDHDLMWYQINKIVAMVYPQWSDAFPAARKNDKGQPESSGFKYPFTQVPTASPLIRLRVGDVIKSNYSRTNLSRLHGIGDKNLYQMQVDPETEEFTNLLTEKDKIDQKILNNDLNETIKKDDFINKEMERIENSSQNVGFKSFLKEKQLDRIDSNLKIQNKILDDFISTKRDNDIIYYYLRPGLYRTEDSGLSLLGVSASPINKKSIRLDHETKIEGEISKDDLKKDFINVEIMHGKDKIKVVADASKILVIDPDDLSSDVDLTSLRENVNKIMSPEIGGAINNPITRSYESGMSRGLAGFITNLDVGYSEFTWETGRIGSKAPQMVKINIGFSPIHDIPPGLDHNGMLRAPVYNVGRINNEFFGDPHDGHGKYDKLNLTTDGNYSHGAGREAALQKYQKFVKKTKN